jgi:hypothetical protein
VRICLFVIKRIVIADLDFFFQLEDPVTARICLLVKRNDQHYLHVHNLYNELDTLPSPALTDLQRALEDATFLQEFFNKAMKTSINRVTGTTDPVFAPSKIL